MFAVQGWHTVYNQKIAPIMLRLNNTNVGDTHQMSTKLWVSREKNGE